MKETKRIVTFSVFKGQFFGHGGEKRTKQIEALVSRQFDYELIQCPFNYNRIQNESIKSKLRRINYLPQVYNSLKSNRSKFSPNNLLTESYKYFRQEKFILSKELSIAQADTIIWENNFPDFFYLPHIVKERHHKKLVACPHNLESLIPLQKLNWVGEDKIQFLERELEVLQMCDEVFTISEEEQWLLNLFGIRAKYLPYFPLGELYQYLLSIRQYREENEKKQFFLIIGSVSNPPTKIGMITLLNEINKISSKYINNCRFKVTGYGTEQLASDFHGGVIDILGYTEETELKGLMKNCRAMIVNQGFSSGALTRIAEMLVAGIPVLSDEGAARTYRRTQGISVFSSSKELAELLPIQFPMPPLPARPEGSFDMFLQEC